MTKVKARQGFVYVMSAPGYSGVKIGRSDRAPHFRAKELSADPVYRQHGKWTVVDYRQVEDMFATESALHRRFRSVNEIQYEPARELFRLSKSEAVEALLETAEAGLLGAAPLGRLRLDRDLVDYLLRLFRETGLSQFMDLQEMWTMSLYPSTASGRYFTLNIDRHEVAFSAPLRGTGKSVHMIYLDPRILDNEMTYEWFDARDGQVSTGDYLSAADAGCSVSWIGTLSDAVTFFDLPMARRAVIAYWYDSLLNLRDRGKRSFFARFHNHNAVQELSRLAS
ncbi:GIY-YIG nuclease family protein [Salipiger sp. IMCC34102]|uniref:GIY-YIG nuclease family protein n=1 Tax=Salipiger sp. IMCC34102 TaxID=2510647 RepID=UPI00101D8754|nr:GIY-YIG nuclease family protein [Salipiger sp. IMCC34102]RYH02711.1 GIY-YIG nuclease family protein [Salipiger sp. IMCC34102]